MMGSLQHMHCFCFWVCSLESLFQVHLQPTDPLRLLRQEFNVTLQPPGVHAPFWLMKVTSERDDANMFLVKHDKIVVARNPGKIEAGESLILYRPEIAKKAPEPLELASLHPVKRMKKSTS